MTNNKRNIERRCLNIEAVIAIGYTAWAIYSGYKVMSSRHSWQETNKCLKVIEVVIVGYIIGAFYLIYLVFKLLHLFNDFF